MVISPTFDFSRAISSSRSSRSRSFRAVAAPESARPRHSVSLATETFVSRATSSNGSPRHNPAPPPHLRQLTPNGKTLRPIPFNARHHSSCLTLRLRFNLPQPGVSIIRAAPQHEGWPVIAISENGGKNAVIVGNPVMIDAYKEGVPGNGKPFPNGAKMAKIHWNPKIQETYPGQPTVPGTQQDAGFMVKDSKRFADSGGGGWGAFPYAAAHGTFKAATAADTPPQENDAKCGFACHTVVQNRDYVF